MTDVVVRVKRTEELGLLALALDDAAAGLQRSVMQQAREADTADRPSAATDRTIRRSVAAAAVYTDVAAQLRAAADATPSPAAPTTAQAPVPDAGITPQQHVQITERAPAGSWRASEPAPTVTITADLEDDEVAAALARAASSTPTEGPAR